MSATSPETQEARRGAVRNSTVESGWRENPEWSERGDLNSRPPVPQTGALTRLRYAPTIMNRYCGWIRHPYQRSAANLLMRRTNRDL